MRSARDLQGTLFFGATEDLQGTLFFGAASGIAVGIRGELDIQGLLHERGVVTRAGIAGRCW